MDILELMKADHDEVAEILDELESLADSEQAEDVAQAASLVNKLSQLVRLHSRSEEVALYEACRDKTQKVREFALQGYEEHEVLSQVLEKLGARRPGPSGEFKALLMVATELFEHHAREEEEKQAFPKLRRAFNAALREEMGQRMLEEKDRLIKGVSGVGVEAAGVEAAGEAH